MKFSIKNILSTVSKKSREIILSIAYITVLLAVFCNCVDVFAVRPCGWKISRQVLCPHCKSYCMVDELSGEILAWSSDGRWTSYKPKGCDHDNPNSTTATDTATGKHYLLRCTPAIVGAIPVPD